nr:hypothetical protein CFP56_04155 [Quercus suber]
MPSARAIHITRAASAVRPACVNVESQQDVLQSIMRDRKRPKVSGLLLHVLETGVPARLAFEMVEECSQGYKLFATSHPHVRATIQLLLVDRGIQMLVQGRRSSETPMAHVAFPRRTIERAISGMIRGVAFVTMPLQLLQSDGTTGVLSTNDLVDGLAIELRGPRTGACFEMVGKAACCDELCSGTERTLHVATTMDAGVEMLLRSQSCGALGCQRRTKTLTMRRLLSLEKLMPHGARTRITREGRLPVVDGIHMLARCPPRAERPYARLTGPVRVVIHMLVAIILVPKASRAVLTLIHGSEECKSAWTLAMVAPVMSRWDAV